MFDDNLAKETVPDSAALKKKKKKKRISDHASACAERGDKEWQAVSEEDARWRAG